MDNRTIEARLNEIAQLLKLKGHTENVRRCSLSADGSRAITCSNDTTAIVWDLSNGGKELLKLEGHTYAVNGCSITADGSRAITCSYNEAAIVWDLSDSGREMLKLQAHDEARKVVARCLRTAAEPSRAPGMSQRLCGT